MAVQTARVNLELARENLERQEDLWSLRLVSREVYEQAVAEVELRATEIKAREVDVGGAAKRNPPGAGHARQRTLRPVAGDHHVAD